MAGTEKAKRITAQEHTTHMLRLAGPAPQAPRAGPFPPFCTKNEKHHKLRGALRSECQVPFLGVHLRKNTVNYGVLSDLSAKSPS